MRSAALIGLNGSIEWFSFLHFDSPRIFDSLLDEDNVHILATTDGIPVDFTFLPGRLNNSNALKQMPLEVPAGSAIYADSGYTNYAIEEMLIDTDGIDLPVARKSNSKKNTNRISNISSQ